MPISEKVKFLQDQKGWTTAELAEASNLPIDTINKIRSGSTRNPVLDTLQRLAAAFNVTVDELIGGTETQEPIKPPSSAQMCEIALKAQAELFEERIVALDKDRNRWRQVAFIMIAICATFLLAILILLLVMYWDLGHAQGGRIIYDSAQGLFG